MSAKTRLACGAVFGLLCFATPALQLCAAETAAMQPFISTTPPPALLSGAILTLPAALESALQASPEVTVYAAEARASEAEIAQAGRLLNPEVAIEVANIAGSGDYGGFAAAETTVQLSQQLELGRKRQHRRSIAAVEHDRALRDLDIARIDLQARIARHFFVLLSAQEHLKLAEEQVLLATQTLAVVEEKIAAGRAPGVEKYRFQSALAEAHLLRGKAVLTLTAARQRLAEDLGRDEAALGAASGDLAILPVLPFYPELEAQISQSPEVVRRRIESEAKRQELALARANRLGDPTIDLGLRNFNDSGDNTLIFGLSLPLPLFDRNQGNIQAASHRLAAAQAQEASGVRRQRAGLAEAWQALAADSAEAQALRAEILPSAEQTFESARYGYQSGKFAMLEMLVAQQSLIESRERYLNVLTSAHLNAVELDRQLGRAPLSTTIDQFTKE